MDPNATLALLIAEATRKAVSPEDCKAQAAEIQYIAADLALWIQKGGFAPSDPRIFRA